MRDVGGQAHLLLRLDGLGALEAVESAAPEIPEKEFEFSFDIWGVPPLKALPPRLKPRA